MSESRPPLSTEVRPAASSPRVGVVLLNWNRCEDTLSCLEQLSSVTYPNFHVVVVDNGSEDSSVETIRAAFPAVTLIENGANLGFAGGCNVGMRRCLEAGDAYLLLLNSDTLLSPEFLTRLVEAAEESGAGMVGPKIYHSTEGKGRHTRRIWYAGAHLDLARIPPAWHRGGGEEDLGQYDERQETGYVCGCCLLARASMMRDIGLLHEPYVAYFEEADWNLRARGAGWSLLYEPQSVIWHFEGGSTQPRSARHTFYIFRNMVLFAERNMSPEQRVAFRKNFKVHRRQELEAFLLAGNSAAAAAMFDALWCARRGIWGFYNPDGHMPAWLKRIALARAQFSLRLVWALQARLRQLRNELMRPYWYVNAHLLQRLRESRRAGGAR